MTGIRTKASKLKLKATNWKEKVEIKRKELLTFQLDEFTKRTAFHDLGPKDTFSLSQETVIDSAARRRKVHVVILGLGCAAASRIASYQLAFCIEFVRKLKEKHEEYQLNANDPEVQKSGFLDVYIYDPLLVSPTSKDHNDFTAASKSLKNINDCAPDYQEEIQYYEQELCWSFQDYLSLSNTPDAASNHSPFKIFIMFHCPHHLYDRAFGLFATQDSQNHHQDDPKSFAHLEDVVLLGNDLTEYIIDSTSSSKSSKNGHVYSSAAALDARYTKSDFELDNFHSNVFTGSYWQSWSRLSPPNDHNDIKGINLSVAALSLS